MHIDRKPRTAARLLTLLPVAVLAFSLTACSGAQRPSADELATGMQQIFTDAGQSDIPDAVVKCIAEKLVDSDVSDEDLANAAKGKDVQTSTDAQKKMTKVVQDSAQECASKQ
ncbi:hypothetical protein [Microbacterium sp.]|uniref:hypothetical protein n=1 Tax=Microbacterium sp. TaxID=51671 RepID=UPI003C74DE40